MRDLYHNIGIAVALPAAAYNADNTPAAIDISDFESAVVEIAVGVGGITFSGSNKIEFKLTHADAADGDFVAVTVDDVQGLDTVGSGGIIKSLIAAHAAADVTRIGYIGGKSFLKLLADFTGTHGAATPIAASIIKGHPRTAPVA